MADTQLYDILAIPKNACDSEIKKAYKKLAKQYHPDKNPAAGDRFKEISFAYEVLSDPQKKSVYDMYGLKALQQGIKNCGHAADEFPDFSGLFKDSDFFFERYYKNPKGVAATHILLVSLEDLYNGKVVELKFKKNVICSSCKGKGGKPGAVQVCVTCKGQGIKITVCKITAGMTKQIQSKCPDCDGEGEVYKQKDKCIKCKGEKIVQETKILEVPIDKGMRSGQRIRFKGEGHQVPDIEPGDVVIIIDEKHHEVFERSGDNLSMTKSITLTEALCGFQVVIKHLDGRDLVITHPPGEVLQPNTIKAIENEGMPVYKNPFEKGYLFIKFDVQFPDSHFTDEATLRKLEALLPLRKTVVIPQGENVEEVNMYDLDAYERFYVDTDIIETWEDYSSDEDGLPNVGMQCAQQ